MAEVVLQAELELLPTDEKGRRSGIRSGYRPALWFGGTGPKGEADLHSCVVRLRGRKEVNPGDKVDADILPLAFGTWPQVRAGMPFDLIEGSHPVGRGKFVSSTDSIGQADVRQALQQTLEEWVLDRWKGVAHRAEAVGRLQPDLVARFRDVKGHDQTLVGEIVARRPRKRDVERIARVMADLEAQLGVIIALGAPSRAAEVSAYEHGSLELGPGLWLPRIRMLTTRDLNRWDPELIPGTKQPAELELIER